LKRMAFFGNDESTSSEAVARATTVSPLQYEIE
jgi:hypothetical protein